VWLLLTFDEVEKFYCTISSCKSLNNKKTVSAFMNSSGWQHSFRYSSRKKQQIVCALFTARAISGSKKSADNFLSLSFSSYSYNHVARCMNASVGWLGARQYVSPNYCYVI